MSATRGLNSPARHPSEFYATPEWCTRAVVKWLRANCSWPMSGEPMSILDPGAGTGAITRVLYSEWPNAEITAVEMDKQLCEKLRVNYPEKPAGRRERCHMIQCDFLDYRPMERYDLCVCNPPYSGPDGEDYALQFVCWAMASSHVGAFLVRLNWLAAAPTKKKAARYEFLTAHAPCVLILGRRPSFGKHTKMVQSSKTGRMVKRTTTTDGTEYCWVVFGLPDTRSRWEILDCEMEVSKWAR